MPTLGCQESLSTAEKLPKLKLYSLRVSFQKACPTILQGYGRTSDHWFLHLQIFFARIPNTITEDELKEVFQRAGYVKEVVLFKTHAAATINKVCLIQ